MRPAPLIASLLLLAAPAAGQDLLFDHLARTDGLPGDEVLALHEDRHGFIWIGTATGLARHEGIRIRTWHHDRKDPRSLPNSTIWDIAEDDAGTIWIATDHGLAAYDERRGDFQRVYVTDGRRNPTSANRIHGMAPDGNGLLWLATEDGAHTIDLRTRTWRPLPPGADSPRLTRPPRATHLVRDTVLNGLWITAADGIVFYDAAAQRLVERPTAGFPYPCLADPRASTPTPDPACGLIWLSTADYRLHGMDRTGRITLDEPIGQGLPKATLQFLARDRTGRLWASRWTHDLQLRRRDGGWMPVRHAPDEPWSITSANAKSWLEDRQGRIWIGTIDGLNVLDPRNAGIEAWTVPMQAARSALALVAAADELLVCTDGDGLAVLDRAKGRWRTASLEKASRDAEALRWGNMPVAAEPWNDGWLVGSAAGVFHWDGASPAYRSLPWLIDSAGAMMATRTAFIKRIAPGKAWVGTWTKGLFEVTGNGPAVRRAAFGGEPLPTAQLLAAASAGREVWLGFNNGYGAMRIAGEAIVQRILHEPDSTGTAYGVVRSLEVHPDGTLYIGTLTGGLGVLPPGSDGIGWLTRSDGLAGDRIEQLALDREGLLWIRTNEGLSRLTPSTGELRTIELPRSIASQGRLSAIAADHDGSLLCAIGRYILDLPPDWAGQAIAPAPVVTDIRFLGAQHAAWPADSTVQLPYDRRSLSIELGTLPFPAGQGIRMAYRLPATDSAWRTLGEDARINLDQLPIGEHRVEIRAGTGGNRWSARPLGIRLQVLPPLWATWWFRLGAAAVAALAAFLGLRAYTRRRLREQRQRFEREQAVLRERERIASDMHDDLGAGLSGLKLRSEMALRVEQDPVKREQLASLAATAGELIGSMRQMIWALDREQASLEDLLVYATSYARTYCDHHGLALTIDIAPDLPQAELTTEQRRSLFLIMKEALHNTVKHARAGRFTITVRWSDGLLLTLADDGLGLPAATEHGTGNGMRNMRRRITALGGSMELRAERGTAIHLRLPLRAGTNLRSIATA
ncbi:MAG: two-component regulator propeller domain-containing protein [Flavobacteriales bacterium]|nr:MAG: two-component regulator propeller domain-containing protein [Flavobacteriales bacterium]